MYARNSKQKFRPISLDTVTDSCSDDADGSKGESCILIKPVPRPGGSPLLLDGQRSGNTLPFFSCEPTLFEGCGDIASAADGRANNNPSSALDQDALEGLNPVNEQKPPAHRRRGVSWEHLQAGNEKISSEVGQSGYPYHIGDSSTAGVRRNSSSVSFRSNSIVESVASQNLPSFRTVTTTSSKLSEASTPTDSFRDSRTITSIQTNDSSTSLQATDVVKAIPGKPKHHGECATAADHKDSNEKNLKEEGIFSNLLYAQTSPSLDSPRRPTFVRKSAPLLHRKFSENDTHLRKLATGHDRYGAEPFPKGKGNIFLPAASSSSTSVDDASKVTRNTSRQGGSEGNRRSMRLFERKVPSKSNEEDVTNPWFQTRPMGIEEEGSLDEEDASTGHHAKPKKIRLKKLGRKLLMDSKEREIQKPVKQGELLPLGTSISASSGESSLEQVYVERINSGEIQRIERELKIALSGKAKLSTVLRYVVQLPERPRDELSNLFYKFLASSSSVEYGIKLLVADVGPSGQEAPLSVFFNEPGKYVPYRELLVFSYVNGPARMKKAILNHSKARFEMLSFFMKKDYIRRGSPGFSYQVHCMARVLNGLLTESAQELVDHVAAQKGFLKMLVRNHIHVPEVVGFVCQLCTANGLSDASSDENRYGAPNAAGVMLLVKEDICNLLVEMFIEAGRLDGLVSTVQLRWQTQVMSMTCLLELSKRCVAVPLFSKMNCSYSSRYMKAVNSALQCLNAFENVDRVRLLLKSGLAILDIEGTVGLHEMVVESNNAAVCALTYVAELLEMVQTASKSRSIVVQRTVGGVDTGRLENLILSHLQELCTLLRSKHEEKVKGRLRIAVVKTFCLLFGSTRKDTRKRVSASGLPDLLVQVLRENKGWSMLHRYIIDCLTVSLANEGSSDLHRAWFEALQAGGSGLLNDLGKFLDGSVEDSARVGMGEVVSYRSSAIEIGFIISKFSENLKRGEFRGLFKSMSDFDQFTTVTETGLRQIEADRQRCCGGPKPDGLVVSVLANAESLAARLDDVNAV